MEDYKVDFFMESFYFTFTSTFACFFMNGEYVGEDDIVRHEDVYGRG